MVLTLARLCLLLILLASSLFPIEPLRSISGSLHFGWSPGQAPFYRQVNDILTIDATKKPVTEETDRSRYAKYPLQSAALVTFCPHYFWHNQFYCAPSAGVMYTTSSLKVYKDTTRYLFGNLVSFGKHEQVHLIVTPETGLVFPGGNMFKTKYKLSFAPVFGIGDQYFGGDLDEAEFVEIALLPMVKWGFCTMLWNLSWGVEVYGGAKFQKIIEGQPVVQKTFANYITKTATYDDRQHSVYSGIALTLYFDK